MSAPTPSNPLQAAVIAAIDAFPEGRRFTARDVLAALPERSGSRKEAAAVAACVRNLWVRRRLDRVQAGTRGRGRLSVYRVARGGES